MAASVTLNVNVNKAEAVSGIQAIADAVKPLTTPIKLNVDTKAALTGLKDLNTIASNLEKQLNKSRGGFGNGVDQQIRQAEASAKAFSNALREQMMAEQQAAEARRGLASSYNEYDQAIHKRESEGRAFSAALKQQMLAEREAEQEARRAGSAMSEAGDAAAQSGSAAASGASGWSVLGGAVASALGHLASRAVQFALRKITQGIRDALTEMKNVDTQLTNISKVSGKTGDELAAIGNRAYDTASKYGEAASTYLESVYNMQKAGMGDQSEAMGELATKTMLVGDTTEDVASKFLIASNAAWQLDGNMSRLSQIVDEADYINNNYATSLDKLAAGMPIVASIASQTGMTAEETMAAIGTITAATQESGTKAATALRALILNISGEVGKYLTEEGEEFEVTEKSVKSMQGLLEKYAKTEMDAAKAAGQLIDPMTAIRAIFKGMKEDDLTDVELFNLLSGMGGKLRTNQLTALVQNFDTLYQDMMNGMKGAAGTADKEIDLMMNSWERKTQVLKNTWTEFIADIVETDTIKGGLDWLTDLVSGLDTLVGKAKNPFFDSESIGRDISDIETKMKSIRDLIAEASSSGSADQTAIANLQIQLEIQQQLLELKQKQYQMEHKEEAENLQRQLTAANPYFDPSHMAPELQTNDGSQLWSLNNSINNIQYEDAAQYQQALAGIASATKDYYDQVKMVKDVLGDGALTDAQKEFVSTWEEVSAASTAEGLHIDGLVDGVDGLADGYYRLVDAEGNVIAYARDTRDVIREQIEATDEQNSADEVRTDVVDDLIQKQQELAEAQQAYDEASDPGERAKAYAELDAAQMAYFDAMREASSAELEAAAEATAGAGALEAAEAGATGEAEATAAAAAGIDFSSATTSAGALTGELRAAAAAAAAISVGPMGGLLGAGFAVGTTNAPGGPTLVNELGPELISENGRAYIANGGKPGVVNLSKGAIVLTAAQTKEALKGGNSAIKKMRAAAGPINSGKVVDNGKATSLKPTVASGQVIVDGRNIANLAGSGNLIINTPTGSMSSVASELKKRVKGKGNGGVGGGGVGGTPAKSVEDLAKETKDILSNLEKQAKLADNRKQYDKEASLYAQGQKEIDKMVAAYKKAGYKETDDEVLDLLNKRYDYEKKKDAASKKTIEEAAKELKDKLSNLEKQADVAEKQEDYLSQVKFYEQAQEAIKTMVERYRKAGYKDDSDEILDLLKKNYDYADKQVSIYKDRWNELIDALETDTEQQELANALAEKQQALEDARLSLENAQKQRTIRTYNAATGQWEWVRDEAKVKSAQESLTKAEKDYADEVKDQAVKEIEKMRDTLADLNDVVLGPALTSVMAMAESSNEFQNFARALNAVYGVGSYLGSTEGSSRVISTANDSHDTIYTFGNVTLTEEQASTMSVAQLAQKLQVLKIS